MNAIKSRLLASITEYIARAYEPGTYKFIAEKYPTLDKEITELENQIEEYFKPDKTEADLRVILGKWRQKMEQARRLKRQNSA